MAVKKSTAAASAPAKKTRKVIGVMSRKMVASLITPEPESMADLAEQMRCDYQVRLAELVLRSVIQAAGSKVTTESNDPRAKLLADSLQKLWDMHIGTMLDCIGDGRVAFEKVFGYSPEANLSYICDLEALPFRNTTMLLTEDGSFDGIELKAGKRKIQIPAGKSWWLAIQATAIEPHGRSYYLGAPREVWKQRRELIDLRSKFCKRLIVDGGVAHIPMEGEIEGDMVYDTATAMAEAHEARLAGGMLLLSNERDRDGNYLYDVTEGESLHDPAPIDDTIDGMDVEQLRAFGIPEKTVIEGAEVGSHSMVSVQMQILYSVCEMLLGDGETSFQDYVINPSVDMNWSNESAPVITISHQPLAERPDALIVEIVKGILTGTGVPSAVLSSGAVDLESLLQNANIPMSEGSKELIAVLLKKLQSAPIATGPPPQPGMPTAAPAGGSAGGSPQHNFSLANSNFNDASENSPNLGSLPTFDGLIEHALAEQAALWNALLDEIDSMRATGGHVDPVRVRKIVAQLNQLQADTAIAGRILGMVSPWRPAIQSVPAGAGVDQKTVKPPKVVKLANSSWGERAAAHQIYNLDLAVPGINQTGSAETGDFQKQPGVVYRYDFLGDAVDWLLEKEVVTPDQLSRMAANERTSVFSAPGIDDLQVLNDLKLEIAVSLDTGESLETFRKRVESKLDLTRAELETQYRTNTKQAYVEGLDGTLQKPEVKKQVGYVMYAATADSRVRDTHWDLDGFVCSVDDPAYKILKRALSDYNCRCAMIPMTESQAEARGIKTYSDLSAEVRAKYG